MKEYFDSTTATQVERAVDLRPFLIALAQLE